MSGHRIAVLFVCMHELTEIKMGVMSSPLHHNCELNPQGNLQDVNNRAKTEVLQLSNLKERKHYYPFTKKQASVSDYAEFPHRTCLPFSLKEMECF